MSHPLSALAKLDHHVFTALWYDAGINIQVFPYCSFPPFLKYFLVVKSPCLVLTVGNKLLWIFWFSCGFFCFKRKENAQDSFRVSILNIWTLSKMTNINFFVLLRSCTPNKPQFFIFKLLFPHRKTMAVFEYHCYICFCSRWS